MASVSPVFHSVLDINHASTSLAGTTPCLITVTVSTPVQFSLRLTLTNVEPSPDSQKPLTMQSVANPTPYRLFHSPLEGSLQIYLHWLHLLVQQVLRVRCLWITENSYCNIISSQSGIKSFFCRKDESYRTFAKLFNKSSTSWLK